MRKILLFALLLAIAAPLTANRAQAQFTLMPYAGYNLDAEAFLIGIGTEFAAPFSAGRFELAIRPSIENVFVDDGGFDSSDASFNVFQVNGDVITRLNAESFNPYIGAGLAIVFANADFNCDGQPTCENLEDAASGSDVGLNLLGGIEFASIGFGAPFVQGRLTLADGSAISILGGLSIPLGQN